MNNLPKPSVKNPAEKNVMFEKQELQAVQDLVTLRKLAANKGDPDFTLTPSDVIREAVAEYNLKNKVRVDEYVEATKQFRNQPE